MSTALEMEELEEPELEFTERPAWIPPEIGSDWDPNPYAYQTEEELMPAGGLHGKILAYVMRDFLERRELMLLMDTFMFYRDEEGPSGASRRKALGINGQKEIGSYF